jgi:hypothetical protein
VADFALDLTHAAGDRKKKAVKPRHRRELGRWTQAVFAVSDRRVARPLPIQLATLPLLGEQTAASVANQATVFASISRSSRSTRFSRRNRLSSSRSVVVKPSLRSPSSSPAYLSH